MEVTIKHNMLTPPSQFYTPEILRKACVFYLLIATPLILLLSVSYYIEYVQEEKQWQVSQTAIIDSLNFGISSDYYSALSDLILLADNHSLFSNTETSNDQLTEMLVSFAKNRRSYYQLRFINTQGKELVRINYNHKNTRIVEKNQLQDKSHRDYFIQSKHLNENSVFVSRFNLNEEFGKIEKPIRPVIRFATPVFDENNRRQGILVLNYLGERLLQHFELYNQYHDDHLLLVNDLGYYLYNDQAEKSWGFQLENRPSFSEQYASEKIIMEQRSGQFMNDKGLFTYDTLNQFDAINQEWLEAYTLADDIKIVSHETPWKIISFVPGNLMHQPSQSNIYIKLLVASILLVILLPISFVWAQSRSQLEDLRYRNHLYAKVVEQSDEIIYITDTKGTILHANKSACQHSGYSLNEIIGEKPSLFKSGMQAKTFYKHLWKNITSGKPFTNMLINRCKDGSHFYEFKTITPLKNDNGIITHYISTGRNITTERHLHQREMDIASRLAGGIMHHFGNLMTSITGYTELAMQRLKKEDNALTDYHSSILETSDKIVNILRDMADIPYRKIDSSPLIDVASALEKIIKSYQDKVPSNITINTQITTELPEIHFTSDLLTHAVDALIDNAIEALPDGGEIELEVYTGEITDLNCSSCAEPLCGHYLQIYISDNGSGIAENDINYIWDPFFSAKDSGKRVGITPGLGLSSVRSIVHAHNGHIILHTSDKGTNIRLLIPLTTEAAQTGNTETENIQTETTTGVA